MELSERKLLEKLVTLGNRFRNTPIVDDDFSAQRDAFDFALVEATDFIKKNKPPRLQQSRKIEDGCMGLQEVIVTTFHR